MPIPDRQPPQTNTFKVAFLTMIGTVFVLCAGALLFWFLMRDSGTAANTNVNVNALNTEINTNVNTNLGIDGNFNFNTAAIPVTVANYDQIWLFGVNATPLQAAERTRIEAFMQAGGGVFATGDHSSLGFGMGAHIPRARSMRDWSSVPMSSPQRCRRSWRFEPPCCAPLRREVSPRRNGPRPGCS